MSHTYIYNNREYNGTNTNPRRKNEYRDHIKNNVRKEKQISISREPKQENSQVENRKNKRLIDKNSNEQHHGIKRSNL